MASLHHKYVTARAVILHDGKVLMFKRRRKSRFTRKFVEYYSIPGGQIDPGETPEQAAIRELNEEMGVKIAIEGLIGHSDGMLYEHYVFAAHIISGIPALQEDAEEAYFMHEGNQYHIMWVPVEKLTRANMRFYAPFLRPIQLLNEGKLPSEILDSAE